MARQNASFRPSAIWLSLLLLSQIAFSQQDVGAVGGNLLKNAGFEEVTPAGRTLPESWTVRLRSRADAAAVISDHLNAHNGFRYIRLYSPEGPGLTLDALQARHKLTLVPGRTYTVSVWARLEPNAEKGSIRVEPGGAEFVLAAQWQKYSQSYTLPADAREAMGFSVRVKDGPIALDAVTITAEGDEPAWPDELTADRKTIEIVPVDRAWCTATPYANWPLRIPVTIREVMGEPVEKKVIKLQLNAVLRLFGYSHLASANVAVFNAATGTRTPAALIDTDKLEDTSYRDEIAFLVDCSPRSQVQYYIYIDPQSRARRRPLSKTLPRALAQRDAYSYQLDVQINPAENRATAQCRVQDGSIMVEVRAFAAAGVSAILLGPDQMTELPLELTKTAPFTWSGRISLSQASTAGVWQLEALVDEDGSSNAITATCIVDAALWWSNSLTPITAVDLPRYAADYIQIGAAQNEKESFFLGIGANAVLQDVCLQASALTNDQDNVIPADAFTFELVEDAHLTTPVVYGPSGKYGDPLIPWRQRTIDAGTHRGASVTVTIGADAPAGLYRGVIEAVAVGRTLQTPIELEVFDFALPNVKSLKLVLGGDMWMKPTRGYRKPSPGETNYYHDLSTPRGILAQAKLMADHYATPFYYHHDKCPYAVVWHYDPESGQAEFDFTDFDKYATLMLEEWDQRYLFLGGKFAGGWRNPGNVWDWNRDLTKARSAYWEEAYPQHLYSLATEEGLRMYETYWRGVGAHLQEKGWLDRAYIYLTDEDKSDEVRDVARRKAQAIKRAHPDLNTLVASNASWRWPDYMDLVDAFTGHISDEYRAKLQGRGGQWWGSYNAIGFANYPLAVTRAIGLKQWLQGTDVYWQWAACRVPDSWVDSNQYYYVPANAGYEHTTFVRDVTAWGNLGTIIYPVPAGEPGSSDPHNDLFVGSLRLQALREAVDDYEYFRLLQALSQTDAAVDAQGFTASENAIGQLKKLYEAGHITLGKFHYYNVDPGKYYALKKQIGAMIGAATLD